MNILLTGASGQIGSELINTCPGSIHLVPFDKDSLNISDYEKVLEIVNTYKPDVVINSAAYTSVELAETEEQLAFQVNKNGVSNLALACAANNIRLIHYSTDYIFDGKKTSPYTIQDKPNPINIYGQSKLEGEREALKINRDKVLIIRTSWIYSKYGNNFVTTMLRLMKNKGQINVIKDQYGTPTWARSVANITWEFVSNPETNGIFHFCDEGSTNWFEFAMAIQEEAIKFNMIEHPAKIIPIESKEYHSKVKRPSYSVLDCEKTWELINAKPDNWRIALGKMMTDYNL